MCLGIFPGDGEAKAGTADASAGGRRALEECLEDTPVFLGGYARSGVGNLDDGISTAL